MIAGAGIGGLTCALALIRRGFRAVVLEQAEALDPVGAGIQLSPNASRILIDLGLAERLEPAVTVPREIRVLRSHNAREIVRAAVGPGAAFRYGAPYWVVHRGRSVEDFAIHAHGVTVETRTSAGPRSEHGIALVGADGLWSQMRGRIGNETPAHFCGRTAWRATVAADLVPQEFR